jgi:hypothetical protein
MDRYKANFNRKLIVRHFQEKTNKNFSSNYQCQVSNVKQVVLK